MTIEPGAAGRLAAFNPPSAFTTERASTAVDKACSRIELEDALLLITCTLGGALKTNGTMQTTLWDCAESSGAGTPSKFTDVPASDVASLPQVVNCASTSCAGPSPLPVSMMISPGATPGNA